MPIRKETLARIAPFIVFMAFIAMDEAAHSLTARGLITLPVHFSLYTYPLRAAGAALALFYFRKYYSEINLKELLNTKHTILTFAVGILVFVLWINMDWKWATLGSVQGFNPTALEPPVLRNLTIFLRLASASIIVPIMEELFWRSFLIRYIDNNDFLKIPIGFFSWTSFIATVALFGLEHNFFVAGMMAGIAYNLLLYRTKSLIHCILAHAITNLTLGVYVLATGSWRFW